MTRPFLIIAAILLFAPGSLAQEKKLAAEPEKSPLSGPSVVKSAAKSEKTLIERDFAGKIKKLDVSPPIAAARLLDLDPEIRRKVDEAIATRNGVLDQIVADNLRLIVELAGAKDSGKSEESLKLLRRLQEKAQPLKDLGPLQRQLQSILTPEQTGQFLRLTQDYWNALIAEREADAKQMSEKFELREFIRTETLVVVGAEIRRAYERVVGQRVQDFEAIIKSLNLSEQQESAVRRIATDSFQKTYGKASPAERARVIAAIFRELDPAQRQIMLDRISAQPEPPKDPAPAKPTADK